MRGIRAALSAGLLGVVAVLALPAMAAGAASAPGNDNPGNAKVIGSLPFNLTPEHERSYDQRPRAAAARWAVLLRRP